MQKRETKRNDSKWQNKSAIVFPRLSKVDDKKTEPPFLQQDVPVIMMVVARNPLHAGKEKGIAIAMTIALMV